MADRRRPGSLSIRRKGNEPVFTGRWRDDAGRSVERMIGPAWMVPVGDEQAKPSGRRIGRWCERRGKPADGWFSEEMARERLRALIEEWERETPAAQRGEKRGVLFRDASQAWLVERKAVAGWKPTTERNYRAMLTLPDAEPRKRGGAPRARLMREFGDREIAAITGEEIRRFLRSLDADETITPRTVNAYRTVLSMIFGHAVDEGWCDHNPVAATAKRRERDPAELVVYTLEQIMLIARRCPEDTIGTLVLTAATTGLRLGELLELRWRDVQFAARAVHVQRSYAAGLGVSSPKGRRGRSLPLADITAQALARLGQRERFTRKDDLVFPNALGEHLDPSTVRAAYITARDAARRDDDEMPALRLHDLRHCFGSRCAASGIDVVTIQTWMGHASINTTRRYMHFAPRADDADRLSRAFVAPSLGDPTTNVVAA